MSPPALTYAIGDCHGCDGLLGELLDRIGGHAAGRPHQLMFLGDYIDRGPQSAAVVQRLIDLQEARPPGAVVCLRGNHEQLCLDALEAGGGWPVNLWRRNGGDATLASYGGSDDAEGLATIPAHHRAWLAGLPFLHQDDRRIFVHAGLEPSRPITDQDPETCLWIRKPFLCASSTALPKHVVHGHTPNWTEKPDPALPELLDHRTNIDTGAYFTGILTAAAFEQNQTGPCAILTARQGNDSGILLWNSGRG